MKTLIFIATALAGITTSCFKETIPVKAEVVRDCTGTYLHMSGQDYKVCNAQKILPYKTGERVRVVFNKIEACKRVTDSVTCEKLHVNAGWIEITKIK